MTSLQQFHAATTARAKAVRANAGRRMSVKPTLPLPPIPARPMARIAYDAAGEWLGRLGEHEDAPAGSTVRLEPALY